MKHELKIQPEYYCRVADGSKTFEVRFNDRGFQMGDEVVLREWDPKQVSDIMKYTGRELIFRIGYVLPLNDKVVVFSLLPAKPAKDAPTERERSDAEEREW